MGEPGKTMRQRERARLMPLREQGLERVDVSRAEVPGWRSYLVK